MTNHPMQTIVRDSDGVIRFQKNAIVRYLLDAGPFDLNGLHLMPFTIDDWEQFSQLTGYSVSGFGELGYSEEIVERADLIAAELDTPPEAT